MGDVNPVLVEPLPTLVDVPITVDPWVAPEFLSFEPAAGPVIVPNAIIFVNRVIDPIAGAGPSPAYVQWETNDAPDPTGASYPGPSAFGSTSDYLVLTIRGRDR